MSNPFTVKKFQHFKFWLQSYDGNAIAVLALHVLVDEGKGRKACISEIKLN